jgi:hypothetical protein
VIRREGAVVVGRVSGSTGTEVGTKGSSALGTETSSALVYMNCSSILLVEDKDFRICLLLLMELDLFVDFNEWVV